MIKLQTTNGQLVQFIDHGLIDVDGYKVYKSEFVVDGKSYFSLVDAQLLHRNKEYSFQVRHAEDKLVLKGLGIEL